LIEVLVAAVVVSLVLVLLFQIITITTNLTQSSQVRMQSMAGLRGAMDRMSTDFYSAAVREDLPPYFEKAPGNDACYFYAATTGYGGERGVSRIGYRIREDGLTRGAEGTGWTEDKIEFSEPLKDSPFVSDRDNPNYELLADRVFRFEVEFIMADGSVGSSTNIESWTNVRSMVVTMAAIEGQALKRASGTLADLAALFPDPPDNTRAADFWAARLNDPAFFNGNPKFPAKTLQGIDIRQRIFPVAH
jgi:type II secretory pathway pseudopilin PulG